MKKHSTGKLILIYFFKTIGVLILLAGVGLLSYYLTMLYFKQTDRQEPATMYQHVITPTVGKESSNLIYAYNPDNGKVEAMLLELFDQDSKNLTYVTIPVNTQVELSQNLFQELIQVNQSLTQTIKLADVPSQFVNTPGDQRYEYGIKVLQDVLPVDIGYFTAMPSEKFKIYYELGLHTDGVYSPTEAFLSSMKKCTTEGDMKDMIEDLWNDDGHKSDLTLAQKQNTAKALSQVNWDNVYVYGLKGKNDDDVFKINRKKSKKLIADIWETPAYTAPQFKSSGAAENPDEPEEQNIEILNGSAIDGLAGRYQRAMQEDGLSVVNIGNYNGIKQETTTIYAKNVKWAKKKLRSYFPKPKKVKVEKAGELEQGIDIQIILGVDADG